MSHQTCVWIRSTILDKAVRAAECEDDEPKSSGKISIRKRVSDSFLSGDEHVWGWSRATVLSGSLDSLSSGEGKGDITVLVRDDDSAHDGKTVVISPDMLAIPKKKGASSANDSGNGDEAQSGIVMANEWASSELCDNGGSRNQRSLPPNDLITLTHLHEPALVFCLRRRFNADKIYTSTGPILLALNPFKEIDDLYDDHIMTQYWARGEYGDAAEAGDDEEGGDDGEGGLPPHVYGHADGAFRSMMQGIKNSRSSGRGSAGDSPADQSILVSGESGSGKTVTTKHIMKYLASLSQRKHIPSSRDSAGRGSMAFKRPSLKMSTTRRQSRAMSWVAGANVESKILESNPIMEAFGNARTVRNDNSSRFGKFIELQFKNTGSLIGASIETYLLEKVRLVLQAPEERNYHIFYELLAGATDEERERYFLNDWTIEDFKMTNQSGTYDRRDGVDDEDEFDALLLSMGTMGFEEEEQRNIFSVTCAMMHASNLEFVALSADESRIEEDNPHLEPVLNLLGLDLEAFNTSLTSFTIQAGKTSYQRSLPAAKAEKGLEALIKTTYSAMFNYIIESINKNITFKPQRGAKPSSGKAAFIGVLDIFGFESFKTNSFEQMCINYCNEALQQQFNRFVFKSEQQEYQNEGIEWKFIEFPDNQDCLDLIDKKGSGIIRILDDQCRAPGTTDKTFANDIYKKCTEHPRFQANFRQVGAQKFGVFHYAGPVEYDTDGFVEKNKDELPKEANDLLLNSKSSFVKKLAKIISSSAGAAAAPASKRGGPPGRGRGSASKRSTVGGQFIEQLQTLRTRIDKTAPVYVRCLKPNQQLISDDFEPGMIADQLRCAGVLEAVRVSRVGYPQRYVHSLFVQRYQVIAAKETQEAKRRGERDICGMLVKAVAKKIWDAENDKAGKGTKSSVPDLSQIGIQKGKTKVFLRQVAFENLERVRTRKMESATITLQTAARGFVCYGRYRRLLRAVIVLQSHARRRAAFAVFRALKKENVSLSVALWCQRMARGRRDRQKYRAMCKERKVEIEASRKEAEAEARKRAEEDARRKAEEEKHRKEEEDRRKAEEEARRKAEEEARKNAEEEARRVAEQEARRKAEEEGRKKAEEKARRKAEEEARRKAAEENARRIAEEKARKEAEKEIAVITARALEESTKMAGQLNEAQSEINILQKQNADAAEEIEKLKRTNENQRQSAKEAEGQLHMRLEESLSELERLKKSLEQSDQEAQERERAAEFMLVQVKEDCSKEANALREEMKGVLCEKTETDRELERVKGVNEQLQAELAENNINFVGALETLRSATETLDTEKTSASEEIEELKAEKLRLQKELDEKGSTMSNALGALKAETEHLRNEKATLVGENEKLSLHVKQLVADVEDFEGKFEETEAEKQMLRAQIKDNNAGLSTALETLGSATESLNEEKAKAAVHIEELNAEVERLKMDNAGFKDAMELLQGENANLHQDVDGGKRQLDEAKADIDHLGEELLNAKKENKQLSSDLSERSEEINALSNRCNELKEANDRLEEAKTSSLQATENLQQNYEDVMKELSDAKAKLEETNALTSQLPGFMEEAAQLRSRLEETSAEANMAAERESRALASEGGKDELLAGKASELLALQEEMRVMKETLDKRDAEVKELRQQLEGMQNKNLSESDEVGRLKAELVESRQESSRLTAELDSLQRVVDGWAHEEELGGQHRSPVNVVGNRSMSGAYSVMSEESEAIHDLRNQLESLKSHLHAKNAQEEELRTLDTRWQQSTRALEELKEELREMKQERSRRQSAISRKVPSTTEEIVEDDNTMPSTKTPPMTCGMGGFLRGVWVAPDLRKDLQP